ncbi:MAG: metal ABC transporter permease [Magnetospirillum sp. WYHS-4]
MADEFLLRGLLAGLGVAMVAGPLGSFVVWRRMAYFGDTLAHAALLGVTLGFVLGLSPMAGVLLVCAAVAGLLVALQRGRKLAGDTLLGILSHGALALGLVVASLVESLRVDLLAYLFGDLLATTWADVAGIWAGGAAVLVLLVRLWRPLLAITVHEELARVEGVAVDRVGLAFMLLMAAAVALAMKVVGILLVTSLLIVPAAAARPLARTPERMAVLAALLGCGAVALGLGGSLLSDAPAGPAVVVAACLIFAVTASVRRRPGGPAPSPGRRSDPPHPPARCGCGVRGP